MSVALYGAALCHSAGDSWIDCCIGAEDLPLTQADSWASEVAHDVEFYWSHEWGIGRSHHSGDGTVVTICLPLGLAASIIALIWGARLPPNPSLHSCAAYANILSTM